ncbi:MAG: LuxR C-terminal-related transcriptional regulator [Nocardioides sp.]|nr:LuxR C-terminal-related transcriptional regulator [Nocardioides sp.]
MDDGSRGHDPQVERSRVPVGTAYVTAPHLLVAQTVAAAARSAALVLRPVAWDDLFGGRFGAVVPGDVVVVMEDLDDARALAEVVERAQSHDHRVVLVVPEPAGTGSGRLLDSGVEVVGGITTVADFVEMVHRFLRGEPLVTAEERERLRAAWSRELEQRRDLLSRVRSLSPRQRRVLELLSEGLRVADVAEVVGVSPGTVRTHVKTLRGKLGVRSQLEAVAMLRRARGDEALPLVPRPRPEAE